MPLQILSDLDVWREVAHVPGDEPGTYQVKDDAYAYVVIGSMVIGMDVLDESTAEEWLTRLRAWEIIDGPMVHGPDGPVPVTLDALRPYFGTRTNAFPAETRAKFVRRVGQALLERAARLTAR